MTNFYVSTTGNDLNNGLTLETAKLTILNAINSAANNDTIILGEGTYTGNFDINKIITIQGPNVNKNGNSSERISEAILLNTKTNILQPATINGIKFKHTTFITDALIIQSGATIKNCVFERIASVAGQIARGISSSSTAENYTIINNLFTGSIDGGLFSGHKTWNSAVFLNNNGKNCSIESNVFNNCRTALNIDNNPSNITCKLNEFSNCGTYISYGGTVQPTTGMITENNIFNISTLGSTLINNSNVSTLFKSDISLNKFKINNIIYTSEELSLDNKFTIESKLYHKGVSSKNGIIYFSQNEQFIIPGLTTIQTAITYAPQNNEMIYIYPGTYGTTSISTISINKSVKIYGANKDISYNLNRNNETILLNHKFDILANDIEINGISISGNDLSGETIFGGNNKTFSNLTVKNTIIQNVNGMCLYYQGTGTRNGITFDNCKISGIGNGIDGTGTSSAFNPWLCKNVSITNCLIENIDYNGINLDSVENATITNNIFKNIGKSGIQLANLCKGDYNIKNNEFTQMNCRYYGWGKLNTKNNILNPYAPRTVNGTSTADWQYYYAGIKFFSNSDPLTLIGTYNIENNTFNNSWCGYQFARQLPSLNAPIFSFKNNIFTNNSHGDIMIYRPNTTNYLYNFKDNALDNASVFLFDWNIASNANYPTTLNSLENWEQAINKNSNNKIILNQTSPALIQIVENNLFVVKNMLINEVLNKSTNNNNITIYPGTYSENLTINKSIKLSGTNKDTTVIQSTAISTVPTIQFTDGSSGLIIENLTIKGRVSSLSTTGSGDSSNNNSAIYCYTTDNTNMPAINNITLNNLIIKNASNGICFNNKISNNISITNCLITNNEGSGVRIATNTETMNGLLLDSCTISNNNLNAINSNPSGTYRPNCSNFTISNCSISNNNKLTVNNSHDISFFGFNGNIEITNTIVNSNHYESKQINGSSATTGGWGLIIYGSNQSSILRNSGNIKLNNLVLSGNVIKSGMGIERYSNLGNIYMNNVNIKNYNVNKANQTWIQFTIGHNDILNSFNIRNTQVKTLAVTQSGDVDASKAYFYNILTNELLSRSIFEHLTQIANQVIDKADYSVLGNVLIKTETVSVSPSEPNSINTVISELQNDTTINLVSGEYNVSSISSDINKISLKALTDKVIIKSI